MFILQDYLEDCVEEQDAAENSQKFDAAYQVAGRTALGLLADRLESFIFRKKRSDLRYFRTWFHILDLFHAGDGVWHKLFIASTQGVLNSSRTEHKKERDTVRERLSMYRSDICYESTTLMMQFSPTDIEFQSRLLRLYKGASFCSSGCGTRAL